MLIPLGVRLVQLITLIHGGILLIMQNNLIIN